jgi:SAM-dependent methyltransferase
MREAGPLGPLCDLGCGPGQIARYLKDHGAEALGMDLSPKMVDAARKLSPDIPFFQGNMLAIDLPEASWGGVAAFYSLIHIPRPLLGDALRELQRVLRPGGLLLMGYHVGEETVHLDEWWEKPVKLDFNFLQTSVVTDSLVKAEFSVEDVIERDPYPEEHPSRRAYIFARKPYGTN